MSTSHNQVIQLIRRIRFDLGNKSDINTKIIQNSKDVLGNELTVEYSNTTHILPSFITKLNNVQYEMNLLPLIHRSQ